MRWLCFSGVLLACFCPCFAPAQEIVSAQSGVVHYLEGAVQIDAVSLEHKPAIYPLLKDGSVLVTKKGRVELMLTPNVFLRLDENSSVKMISSALTATRLEFLNGSCILDALAAANDVPVDIKFKDASIHFGKNGLYRIDNETEVLQAYSGEAVVQQQDKKTKVDPTRLYFFELATDTNKFSEGTDDEFLDWARNRYDVITEENQMAQADAGDADDADPDLGGLGMGGGLPPLYNYGVPHSYGLPPLSTYPNYSSISPYSSLYNGYVPSTLFPLPLLPGPVLVIGGYRTHHTGTLYGSGAGTISHWPVSSWNGIGHSVGVGSHPGIGTITSPHPIYSHPATATHVGAPAAHAVGIGHR
jgi:hypothetical protein